MRRDHAANLLRRLGTLAWVTATSACGATEFDFATREEWESESERIREGITDHLDLDPTLAMGAPRVVLSHGLQVGDGYTIENIALESLPGIYVTGNLYRPLDSSVRHPAVLNPHGHFYEPGWYPRTRPDMQARCATLARMGAVAFAWDMVGVGDSTELDHHSPLVPALQTWNSLRALEFLQSLPDVDAERIAVTGGSGGASQGFVLTALDERPVATVPVAMLTAEQRRFDTCEDLSPPGLHGNLEVAAMAAPRAQLVISDGEDWTADNSFDEVPFLRHVYGLYDASAEIEHVHFENEGHDYGPSKRAAAHEFLGRRLGLTPPPAEPDPVPHATLVVFDREHPRPADALVGESAVGRAMAAIRTSGSR